ncbi:MAG: hypothetical protein ACR2OR_09315 [Hyphomicrobiales bacterium]
MGIFGVGRDSNKGDTEVKKILLATGVALCVGAGPVFAADGTGNCVNTFRSALLDLPQEQITVEVNRMYEESLDVSKRDSSIYNQSQLYTWANESKVACAKAIGFMEPPFPEYNEEQINQCDCYYNRMQFYILK